MTYEHNRMIYELNDEAEKILDLMCENLIDRLFAQGKDSFSVSYKDVFDDFLSAYGSTLVKDIR